MARKTNGTTVTNPRKKTQVPDPPAAVQVTPDVNPGVRQQLQPEQVAREAMGRESVTRESVTREEIRKDMPRNGTLANHVPVNLASANIEERFAAGLMNSTCSAGRLRAARAATRVRIG